ncbi:MAG: DNA-binding SARP family transcriptional activator [Arcticibacterium sp.]|jgi:DNA-binding SARP family transcriptional activator
MRSDLDMILAKAEKASLRVYTLGRFEVWRDGEKLSSKAFGRDKSLQLFQFFLMPRNKKATHKEQIMDKLWEDDIDEAGFKVALHGINKALEPDRKSHAETKYFHRAGQTYQLNPEDLMVDAFVFEALMSLANQHFVENPKFAIEVYRKAVNIHKGTFLPNRIYEDWSSEERERLQLMFLSGLMALAELLVVDNPIECIQLCQEALLVDIAWEDAYRVQMQAYSNKGNRPMTIKTYKACEKILAEEFGIKPLPETKKIYTEVLDRT